MRWMIERKRITYDNELLLIVEVYAPHENKEIVKQENRQWTYRRELVTTND